MKEIILPSRHSAIWDGSYAE